MSVTYYHQIHATTKKLPSQSYFAVYNKYTSFRPPAKGSRRYDIWYKCYNTFLEHIWWAKFSWNLWKCFLWILYVVWVVAPFTATFWGDYSSIFIYCLQSSINLKFKLFLEAFRMTAGNLGSYSTNVAELPLPSQCFVRFSILLGIQILFMSICKIMFST